MSQSLFPLVISDSGDLADIALCPFKWYLSRCESWKFPSKQKSIHLIAGAAYAKAQEVARKGFYQENLTISQAISLGKEALYAEYLNVTVPPEELKTPERVALAFTTYHKEFPMDLDEIQPITMADGSKGIEIVFAIELPVLHPELNIPLLYKGKLDMLVKHERLNHIYTYDDKTTSSMARVGKNGSPDVRKIKNKYLMAGQHISYNWVANYLGVKTEGTHIREVCFSKTNGVEFADIPDILYSPFLRDNWYESLIYNLQSLADRYKLYLSNGGVNPEKYFHPSFKDDCVFYAQPCEFMQLCQTPSGKNSIRENMVQMVWDRDLKEEIPLSEMRKSLGL